VTEEEHLRYHLAVSFTGCGVPGCSADIGMLLHSRACQELPEKEPPEKKKYIRLKDQEEDIELWY
jgi:hypothetical protein